MPDEPLHYESRDPAHARHCPFCRSTAVRLGNFVAGADFVPDGLKKFAITLTPNRVIVGRRAAICCDCGAVWSRSEPAAFRKIYSRWAKGSGE